jgi:GcvH upstream region-like protein
MFSFFRRYQRAIFFLVTTIIILSFSFFGTYSAMVSTKGEDPVVFKTTAGKKVRRSEAQTYISFLSTGAAGGPSQVYNFFNDGFLERDILSTCVGQSIFHKWKAECSPYLAKKKPQESTFNLYQHPKAPFLGTEYVWTYFVPELKDRFFSYKKEMSSDMEEIFKQKAALFALERQFPGNFVKQLILFQQQQAADWLEPDATLQEKDLSLFGYTSASDWFGDEYLQKVVQTVIDGALMAQKEGIQISDEEVTNSLYQNLQAAAGRFGDLQNKPLNELVQLSLGSLGLDFPTVQKIWRDVLLFRQAFTQLPNHIAVSAFPFRQIYEDGANYREMEKYSLQPCLKMHSMQDLTELYVWQKAVLTDASNKPFSGAYRPVDEVMASWPEFVEQRFSISYRMVGPEQLEPLIRLKDLWHWQCNEGQFKKLAEQFPRLLEEKSEDPESRMQAIEHLPISLRLEVDAFSKKQFILEHPEWIEEQLKTQEMNTKALFISPEGKIKDFVGINNTLEFHDLLKQAPLGEKSDLCSRYSQDGIHFYEIIVLERSSQWELVPLTQLREEGTLARVVLKLLEAQYPSLRKQNPKAFLDEKGEWKPFQEVKLALIDAYLAPLFRVLDAMKPEIEKKYPTLCQWNTLQEVRFALFLYPLMADNMKKLAEGVQVVALPIQYQELLTASKESMDQAHQSMFDLVLTKEKVRKDQLEGHPEAAPFFSDTLKENELLVFIPKSGLAFLKVVKIGQDGFETELRSTLYSMGDFISESARREKIESLFQQMTDKGAK